MTDDLVITGLCKRFEDREVLHDINFRITAGGIHCLMGPSGCGKTTLLRTMLGLETADAGSITGMPATVGCQFQEDRLCADFSVRSNLRLARPNVTDCEIRTHLSEVLLEVELHTPVRSLSGGMRRRVSFVRAILTNAPLLLFDEPFKGLDTVTRQACVTYLLRHTKRKTVLLITHSEQDATDLSASLTRWQDLSPLPLP